MVEREYRAVWRGSLYEVLLIDYLNELIDLDSGNIEVPFDEVQLLMSTGTRDVDNKEVWEGEILQPKNRESAYYVVVWSDIHNGFKRQYKFIRKFEGSEWEETALLPLYSDSHRVVGNATDNPELLGVKE